MRTAKVYREVTKLILRTEILYCPFCRRYLRRSCTLNERKIVTVHQVFFLVHCGYRCPDEDCPGHGIIHRNAQADALALPGFTFGLDVLVLAGTLRLGEHRTLDEVHWALLERLGPLNVSISRREVGYLIETYAALLRTASEVAHDEEWLEQMQAQGGMLLSIDGIQPDQGNTTVYLVRDDQQAMRSVAVQSWYRIRHEKAEYPHGISAFCVRSALRTREIDSRFACLMRAASNRGYRLGWHTQESCPCRA